ncbi:MAG: Fic family protein [Asticcacaulis sp.]|uniref:Fic family protein n=1 Tax=Asticcacaulis sp. TaxID=1872648 RepID=UPI003F7C8858
MAGYAEVMETVYHAWSDTPVTENHIKQLHRDLLHYSDKDERHRGEYKTVRNDVGAFDAVGRMIGVLSQTATPFDTPHRMAELVAWLNDARERRLAHPLFIIAVFTTRNMVRQSGASADTLGSTFTTLVAKGLLARRGGGRSTWYGLP